METFIRKNTQFEILTPTGWSDFDGIRRSKTNKLIHVKMDGKELFCTPDHGLKKDGQLIEAMWLGEEINKQAWVYDPLEVKKQHLYYANGLVSKNCEFMGSSGTLIAGWKLRTLFGEIPLSEHEHLSKYREPLKDHIYAITADVSEGKALNYSAFHVTDITSMPYHQVCTYRCNTITPGDFAEILVLTAEAYNHACILIEYMSLGPLVSQDIWDTFEYDNILFTKSMGRSGRIITQRADDGADMGLKMTIVTKKQGCLWLKLLIEQDQYIIHNQDTIEELARFSKQNNTYMAEEGATDDMVMSLVVFAWMTNQQYFKDLTNINTIQKLRDKTPEDVEADLEPVGLMMWKIQGDGSLPSTAEIYGRDVWSDTKLPLEYSPYINGKSDFFENPWANSESDSWDKENLLPNF